MRAAILSEYGNPPALGDRAQPAADDGTALVELRAAALNPVDVAIGAGTFPGGKPPVPYVPGIEGVGVVLGSQRLPAGTRVFAMGGGLGVAGDGTFSERYAVPEHVLIELPEEVDDVLAAALGVAGIAGWMPLSWAARVRAGETVLVLGATGTAGTVAVQAAKILGAGRVVAAGRDERRLARARAYGADDTVELQGEDVQARLAAAFGGSPPTLIFDPLWGSPIEAALAVAGRGARIVHVGQSAGPSATLLSGHVRTKQLQILGYSNFAIPQDELDRGYRELLGHAAAGRIRLEVEAVPLPHVGEAWARQAGGSDVKLVLVP
jgi:NADPH:quinone reductase-like Zn-dependent oxidoreductase